MTKMFTKFILGFLVVLSLVTIVMAAAPVIDTKNPDSATASVNEGSSQEFNITASDADNDISSYSWSLDGSAVGENSTNYTYTPGYGDSGSHTLMINVTDVAGSNTTNTWNVTVNNTNRVPDLAAISAQTMTTGSENSFTVTASDEDLDYGDTLTYTINNTALTITKVSDTSATVSWTPTVSDVGTYSLSVTVTDGSSATDTETFTLTVNEVNNLVISDLDVDVDGEKDKNMNDGETISKDAEPGSVVELSIKVSNDYSFDLRDVSVEATLRNIGEDNDNLEEESDEFDLDDGDDERVTLEFNVPLKVEDKDYTLTIDVKGKDRNGTRYSTEWTIYLDVKKEKHNVIVSEAYISPITVRCENKATIDFEVTNIGRNREDEVVVEARNSEFGLIFKRTEIDLDEDIDEDDNDYSEIVRFDVPEDLDEDVYPIIIKAYYDVDRLTDSKTVNLVKEACTPRVVVDPVKVIIQTPDQLPWPSETTPQEEVPSGYLFFLAASILVVLGLLGYGIRYLVMKR